MIGITNAPQGSGSGGNWTKRFSGGFDWSDMFELVGSYTVKAKKDILFVYQKSAGSDCSGGVTFIPKGCEYVNQIILNVSGAKLANNALKISCFGKLLYNQISSGANISGETQDVTFTTDGSTVTLSMSNNSTTFSKSDFQIWTRD